MGLVLISRRVELGLLLAGLIAFALMPALPHVPTLTESGLPNFDVKSWHGVLAPLATPRAIIDKLSAEVARILTMPDTIESLVSQGMAPFISTPEQFAALLRSDTVKFGEVIKAANISAD